MTALLIILAYSAIFALDGLPLARDKGKKDLAVFYAAFFISLAYTVAFAAGAVKWSPFEALMKAMIGSGLDFQKLY